MINILRLTYKAFGHINHKLSSMFDYIVTVYKFSCLGVRFVDVETSGIPFVDISCKNDSSINIAKGLRMNNGAYRNQIGFGKQKCYLIADGGSIYIGENCGMSQTALIAFGADIYIGENVKIGAGVKVYTTNFHSLNFENRRARVLDSKDTKTENVSIGNDCFIGAGTIILKGVSIGDRSIIGAGSVVVNDIPSDTIWGGNPAVQIRQNEILCCRK